MPFFACIKCKSWLWYNPEAKLTSMLCGCGIWHNFYFQISETISPFIHAGNNELWNIYTGERAARLTPLIDDPLFDSLIRHHLNNPLPKIRHAKKVRKLRKKS